ncbi:MAG: phosphoribosyltransferase [Pirellulales bacterium]
MRFPDRYSAGRKLAEYLAPYRHRPDVLVLALPRGGVPVAFEVAKALDAPLDVFLVRKLGVPGHEELAMGAVASGGARTLNRNVVGPLRIPKHVVEYVAQNELAEIERQQLAYRHGRVEPQIEGRIVILVDDGLATGSTMQAAVHALRERRPQRIVVAVPVGAAQSCAELRHVADEVVCPLCPRQFMSVGSWYEDFSQTPDVTVTTLLEHASHARESRTKAIQTS